MSRARAPGKAVLSGAYAVLEGAPALVAAVDRYALADTARPAPLLTPEVAAALEAARAAAAVGAGEAGRRGAAPWRADAVAPWFEAEALRDQGQKLGLGSSAAILVASLAALALDEAPRLDDAALAAAVFEPALVAHREAQGGGSGIDVAAACFGGFLRCWREGGRLVHRPTRLPGGVSVGLWSAGTPASTSGLVAAVRALAARDAPRWERLLGAQIAASQAADAALEGDDANAFVNALMGQRHALAALGAAAGAPIVTEGVARIAALAEPLGVAVLPSGAGGGDIVLHATRGTLPTAVAEAAAAAGLRPLALVPGARGVHAA